MVFRLLNESVNAPYIFRGVGHNHNPSENYFGGKFFADNPMDASNYGEMIEVFTLNGGNLYKGECSVEYCKQKEVMFYNYPLIPKISDGKFDCLDDVYEELILNGEDPNLGLAIFQYVARLELEKDNYQGAEWTWEDELIPHQYQIWDMSILTHIETLSDSNAIEKY